MEYVSFSQLSVPQTAGLRALYEEAFPAWEREPFTALLESDEDPLRLQLAMLDGDDPVGLAALSRLTGVPWWFLEYFAVVRDRRSSGLGGELWKALLPRLTRPDGGVARIVMEVEPPDEVRPDSAEGVIRERRVRFYERRGARMLPVRLYRVPRLSDAGTERMLLLVVPSPGEDIPRGRDLAALVTALYQEGYGLASDHPLPRSALGSIPYEPADP